MATVSARRYGLSASTIHNRLRKKKNSHQCGPPLKDQAMTRRHRLAYVQWARHHFNWQCVDWNRVSFSGKTRFALGNAGGKTHKQALLGLLHAGKGSIWWGQFRGLGWKNGWPEDILCCHARQFQCIISTASCDLMPYHFYIIFTHKKLKWYLELKQNKKAIECNVFLFVFCCCFFCFFFVLSFLKDVEILSWKEINAMCR